MQAAKEKISNLASVAKERMTICKAKVEEQATARTEEEKELAKERGKHAAEKLSSNHHHQRPAVGTQPVVGTRPMVGTRANQPVGTAGTVPVSTVPTYPLGGHPPGQNYV
ncbi:hypothetical protein BDE02_03G080400 [Populus trichocarpa]|nr:hypothetical protein BDE02_03G080400 [Populus trichocarpa]